MSKTFKPFSPVLFQEAKHLKKHRTLSGAHITVPARVVDEKGQKPRVITVWMNPSLRARLHFLIWGRILVITGSKTLPVMSISIDSDWVKPYKPEKKEERDS